MQHLIDTRTCGFEPLHEVRDEQKLAGLVASLGEHGWDGPPLVVEGECAVTGSHRLAAVGVLSHRGEDLDVPASEVDELAAEYGLDWGLLRRQYDYLDEAAQRLAELLPVKVVDTLGLDVH